MHENHVAPTQNQVSHENFASQNKAQFASFNHGQTLEYLRRRRYRPFGLIRRMQQLRRDLQSMGARRIRINGLRTG